VTPSWMVSVSASVNLPLDHKVQKFSSGTGSPGWSGKKGRKTVVVVWCGDNNDITSPLYMQASIFGAYPKPGKSGGL